MSYFLVEATAKTPLLRFESATGSINISGRSIPDNAEEFWAPALDWIKNYAENPAENTVLTFDLEYLNISSSKRVLFILYRMNELNDAGYKCEIHWRYKKGDAHIKEVGQDYDFMVKIPFQFDCYEEKELAMAI